MFKNICKNIWAARKSTIWLFIELVVVTIVTWVVIDPVIVNYYVLHNEMNYDVDRLVLLQVESNSEIVKEWVKTHDPSENLDSLYEIEISNTVAAIRSWPEVEQATPCATYALLNGDAIMIGQMQKTGEEGFNMLYKWVEFPENEEYFQTYGFRPVAGSPSLAELDEMHFGHQDKIITRTMARALFPNVENPVGKYLSEIDTLWKDTSSDFRIVGVIEDIRYRSTSNEPYVIFNALRNKNFNYMNYVVRLKEGVNLDDFCARINNNPPKELDGYYLNFEVAKTYRQQMDDVADTEGVYADIKLKLIVAVLFLINLCLGVVGAFYMQTRKRHEEVGIMRSFGANRGSIMSMLMVEGWLLATVAWLIGCGIYLLWALKEGLEKTINNNAGLYNVPVDWTHRFWVHFPLISLVVYAIIMVVVLIGICMPARQLSRVDPVDALREE